jgi:voltage-gated potassium channel
VLRQSGADSVIPTAESAGHLLGLSLLSPVAGQLMEDLLDAGRGLEVVQRPIERSELGVAPSSLDATGQIVLAVIRAGVVHRFDARDIKVLDAGDEIVVIRHTGA